MNVCVCLDAMTGPLPLPDALDVAGAAGAIEFWDWRGRDLEQLHAEAERRSLPVVIFSGNTFEEPLVDAASHGEALRHLGRSIEIARRLGTTMLVAHTGYTIGGVSHHTQWKAAVAGLRAAGELAGAAGITLAVEPLNSALDHPGYFLDTLPDALELIREVDLASVRLLLDVYHMRMMHGDLLMRLPEALAVTAHVHVADVPGRREPGSGAIDWPQVARALHADGYGGYVGLECWPTGEPAAAVGRALEVLTS
ncbi:MAG TPA: TIM barrel protein [bacterium]|nr:TIM barrel protein [bacterium]